MRPIVLAVSSSLDVLGLFFLLPGLFVGGCCGCNAPRLVGVSFLAMLVATCARGLEIVPANPDYVRAAGYGSLAGVCTQGRSTGRSS